MNQATLSHLIQGLGGGTQVIGFLLVLARLAPLFLLAPLFSATTIPTQVRTTIAVALAIGLTGVALHGQHLPTDPLAVAGLIVVQVLVGMAFSFALAALMAAIQFAGGLIDILSGFSFGATIDPINGNQGGVLAQLYGMLAAIIFIAIGGDAWTLRGLTRTFQLVPLGGAPKLGPLVAGAEQATVSVFVSALEVAAPALLAMLITDVAFGMVSRVVPQLNVFSVALPLKVGVALLVVAAALPFLGGWMSDQLASSVGTALHSLRIA
jgi:flagellar biosynthetic protein FliR